MSISYDLYILLEYKVVSLFKLNLKRENKNYWNVEIFEIATSLIVFILFSFLSVCMFLTQYLDFY